MSIAFIAGIAVLVLIGAIAFSQRSGPRVTRIETHKINEDREDNS